MAENEKRTLKEGVVERALDRIVVVCGNISAIFLLVLMLLVFADVFCRYFFKKPILGGIELVEFLMVLTISLALGYGQYLRRHVFVEIFYQKLKGRVKTVVDIVISACCLLMYILISYTAFEQGKYLMTTTLTSTTLLIPAWPFRIVLSIGALIFCMAIAKDIIVYVKNFIYRKSDQEKSIDIDISGSI